MTKDQLLGIIQGMSEDDIARFLYCQEMAGTYLAVGQFEDMLISAMQMCDRLKVHDRLGEDADRWERFLAKRELLQDSTLGSLIKILDKHGIVQSDIGYLRWIKDKRDHFVHRWFHDGAWPGDLDREECRLMSRRLLAIQMWLSRAERQIWFIFERAGLLTLDRIEDGTLLVMNSGLDDMFGSGGWNEEVASD
jgi:hypothetical protein